MILVDRKKTCIRACISAPFDVNRRISSLRGYKSYRSKWFGFGIVILLLFLAVRLIWRYVIPDGGDRQVLKCDGTPQGVIRIPAVVKGLNNQRMRIVQDIAVAAILGAAVELPAHAVSRYRSLISLTAHTVTTVLSICGKFTIVRRL